MNIKDKLEAMKKAEAANAEHEREWREKRIYRLPATQDRLAVWNACKDNADKDCHGCPWRYKCEEFFPETIGNRRATVPTDFTLKGEYFEIEEENENG